MARRLHKELGSCEPAKSEVRGGKDQRRWSVGVRTLNLAVKPETRERVVESKTQNQRDLQCKSLAIWERDPGEKGLEQSEGSMRSVKVKKNSNAER